MADFRIPFTISSSEVLKKRSNFFISRINYKKKSALSENLKNAEAKYTTKEYLGIVAQSVLNTFVITFIIISISLAILRISSFFVLSLITSLMVSIFVLFNQMVYPKIFVSRRQRDIEKNLLSGMEDMLVQINSGIPLFTVLVNISSSDYGALSNEFKKAVIKINAGSPEQEVLEGLSKTNPSVYFKRVLWQISNGMNAGSDMGIVIKDSIKALSEEQLIQIQDYGNKLNPLMVFYMLVAVIIPSLAITFLTILSSMLGLPGTTTMFIFGGLFFGVAFVQIMFLGLIKSKRPSLL
ncbi:MAG: type II secretion system F family protein [Nanoarchaeota archaeon]|nr:type II secretion system F family protein [Nanoarchaeota archaeon]